MKVCFYLVALMIEDEPRPEHDTFVFAGNKNLRENIRHQADLLDLVRVQRML